MTDAIGLAPHFAHSPGFRLAQPSPRPAPRWYVELRGVVMARNETRAGAERTAANLSPLCVVRMAGAK